MTDVCLKMLGGGESPAKCRDARRRRFEMRRFTAFAGDFPAQPGSSSQGEKRPGNPERLSSGKRCRASGSYMSTSSPPPSSSSPSSPSSSSSTGDGAQASDVPSTSGKQLLVDPPPPFGTVSLSGRTREMEDAVSTRPGFFQLDAPLHFFAVFDGHGGSHVSTLCKERMHVFFAEELRRWSVAGKGGASSSSSSDQAGVEISEDGWTAVMGSCFQRMDELALTACACGHVGHPPCGCERAGVTSEIVGSTAVVAVLTRNRIVVANCGDSRAVLSRGGRAFPLSFDHKPDRPDELARIEAAGGRVIYLNGARVLGILAMSRALGDKYLKPVVISEPEISITERTLEDECIILASDGLWDVMSNELACDIARRCLREGSLATGVEDLNKEAADQVTVDQVTEDDASERRCSLAAALLTRLALGRKSNDNISVIVIDTRRR